MGGVGWGGACSCDLADEGLAILVAAIASSPELSTHASCYATVSSLWSTKTVDIPLCTLQ